MRRALGMPMDHAPRKTGIPLIEEIPWGSHIALLYETRCDLLDTCAAFFRAGLQSKESCSWALAEWVPVEAARQALRANIPGFDRYEAAGSMELVAGHELKLPEGPFDVQWVIRRWNAKLQQALEGGYEGLRVGGHAWIAASRSQQYFEDEREVARAIEGRPILAMGTYDLGGTRAVDVLDVVRAHHFTLARRRGDWQLMETAESKQANALIRQIEDVSDISDASVDIIPASFHGHALLTVRERVVLEQIVKGASSKEIARDLVVSPRTVDFHRANILQKLGVRNTAELVRVVLSRN
jgi:DNA-binding CsgD family transcriptional regulator